VLSLPSLLSPSLAVYAGTVAVLTLVAGLAYRRVWQQWRQDDVTPTGFGALLAPVMLGAVLIAQASTGLVVSLAVVTLVTAIFWIDDLVHLSARIRLLASFLAGLVIGSVFFAGSGVGWIVALAAILAAGCLCVVLTNMVNFCDGADLNLASFVALTAILMLAYQSPEQEWTSTAIGALAFILPFAVMNSRPRTIYLGDSGSFAFAGLLTTMAAAFVQNPANLAPEAAIPAALPMLDVAYVLAVRLIEKHDLLTRNYLHLYQRLNRRYAGFGYLLPQFVNAALCLSAAQVLQAWGAGRIVSIIVAIVGVTVPFYLLCRRVFLAGAAEGPLYETRR
jgi:UDP-N-acetylmuramyl pentapeptide phosphotransferase/UDP-N-acetylglucosamine-1-phosphate transferase